MKTFILTLCFIIISSINLFSQPEEVMINPFWYFYADNYLDAKNSGMGYAGISLTGGIESIYNNPASLNIPGKYQAGLQYTIKSSQPWLTWLEYTGLGESNFYLMQNLFSGSIGFAYRINKNFQTGFLYSNPVSMYLDAGESIITNEFGQELSRYNAYDKYASHSFSVPAVYSKGIFSIGININYSLHRRFANFDNSEYTSSFDRFNIAGGIIILPLKNLSIGASFMPEISGNSKSTFKRIANETNEKVMLPMQFCAGLSYSFGKNTLMLAADYRYLRLSARNDLRDMHRIHFGIQYPVNKNWIIRAGFFNFPDSRKLPGNYSSPQKSYNQIFLTAGGTYQINNFEASLAIIDSHVSSGVIKNTYINGGVTFNFK